MVDAGGSLACLEEDGEKVYAPYPRQCDLNVSVPSIVMIHHREPVVRPTDADDSKYNASADQQHYLIAKLHRRYGRHGCNIDQRWFEMGPDPA